MREDMAPAIMFGLIAFVSLIGIAACPFAIVRVILGLCAAAGGFGIGMIAFAPEEERVTDSAVYQQDGQWFFRCRTCYQFDGAFDTKALAQIALYNHFLRSHS